MQLKCLLSRTKKIKCRLMKKGESRRRDGLNIVKNMDKKQARKLILVNQILGVEAEKFTLAWDDPET